MDKRSMRIILLTVILACSSFLFSTAQPIVKTSVDKYEILIGDQFKFTIEAGFDPAAHSINWPVIPDSLQHFEVVHRGKLDSLYQNNKLSGLVQTITLTSFDSGKWTFPPFLVNFQPANAGTPLSYFTDSVPITVSFSVSDTSSQLKDIKPIREADTIHTTWYWIGAGVLLIALVVFLIWFYRHWKKNKSGSLPFQSKLSPYEEAIKELDQLKGYNLAVSDEARTVHSRLSEILKRYLTRSQRNNYLNKTTGDVLIMLRDQSLNTDMLSRAASSLRCNDAVKFAKYIPPVAESEACIQSVKEVINVIQLETVKPKL